MGGREDIHLLVFCLCLIAPAAMGADVLTLNDGLVVRGEIVQETDKIVVIKVKFGTVSYDRREVKSIERGEGGEAAGAPGAAAAGSARAAEWRDEVVLNSGEKLLGLLVSEGEKEVAFDTVMSGRSVSRTLLIRTTISRREVRDIRRLTDAQRAEARAYLKNLRQEAQRDAVAEKGLKVERTVWTSKDKKRSIWAKKVELEHFVIEADTEEDFLRKAAFKLAKVFEAYKQHFGVDRNQFRKVRVVIFNSMQEYYATIGRKIAHPAFYHPQLKLIAAGCEMARYKAAIAEIRRRHDELTRQLRDHRSKIDNARAEVRRKVNEYSAQVNRAGRTTPRGRAIMKFIRRLQVDWEVRVMRMEKPVKDIEGKIRGLNRRNDAVFDEYTLHVFRTLYHEGFHAFLDQFLFEEELVKHVPRWLNEGLAQYFELARVEGPRLVLGREDRKKLAYLRGQHREGMLIPIEEMVTAGAKEFLAEGADELAESAMHYAQAWFLVHLLGEKGRLKKGHFRAYVRALAEKKAPTDALSLLTGMETAELNAVWEAALKSSIRLDEAGSR